MDRHRVCAYPSSSQGFTFRISHALRRSVIPALFLAMLPLCPAASQPLILPGARFQEPPPSRSREPPAPQPRATPPEARPAPSQPTPSRPAPSARRPSPAPAAPAEGAPALRALIGAPLWRNGRESAGSIEFVENRAGFGASLLLAGMGIDRPTEACAVVMGAVVMGANEPVPIDFRGSGLGRPSFAVEAPACPIVFDVLDGAILVREPRECRFAAADCLVRVGGMWGPDAQTIAARFSGLDRARVAAEDVVRNYFATLAARERGEAQRTILSERAAFSAERDTLCRDYAGESDHGFCTAQFSQARAAALARRVGEAPPPSRIGRDAPGAIAPSAATAPSAAARPVTAAPEAAPQNDASPPILRPPLPLAPN